jgi:putative ABC transport system permease protein
MRVEHWLYKLPLMWRSIARRQTVDRELDDEIQYHLEQQVDALVGSGIDRDEAWQVVRRDFGGVELAKDQCRDARGVQVVDSLRQDVRYAGRTLRRNRGFATVAVLTLALGIGANTAVFSLVDGILLSRLPYPGPEQLVSIKDATYPNGGFAAMRDEVRGLDVGAYAEGHSYTLTGSGEAARLTGTRVSAELFSILGVRPEIGRWLRRGDDIAPQDRFVVLSHSLWVNQFHRDATIVGRSILLDGIPREVVAVMPASFQFPSARTQIWVPLSLDPRNTASYWGGDYMPIVGRLRPGATTASALADVKVFQSRIGTRFPWRMPDAWNRNLSVISLQEALVGNVRPQLLILIAAVALVLVIACANVANLSLSRAIAREREIVVRTAIGASPRRIAGQLLTESVILASLGAVVGLLFATQALAIMKLVLPADTPRLADVHLNWRVLSFTGALAVLTGCAFGLAPVARALRLKLRTALDAGGRSGSGSVAMSLRSALTIGQIACAVLLVISAGLLVRSLWSLSHSDPGFQPEHVVTARVSPAESVCREQDRCLAFYRSFEARLQGAAGITSAALVNTLPLTGAVAKRTLELEGFKTPGNQTQPLFWLHAITADYFRVMNVRLVSGRAFTTEDLTGRPAVAIVPLATARKFWPGTDPIGRHIRFIGEQHWHTIVGVVADVRAFDLTRDLPEWTAGAVYVPYGPNATMEDGRIPAELTLTLGTTLDPAEVTATLRRAVTASAGGDVAISDVRTMETVVADAVAAPAATASLLVTMAGLALVLGSIGVYGVLSFLVSRRTRDLGIRIALGAQRRDLFWLVIKEGSMLCGAGVVIGFAGALAATRLMSSELYGISPTDPLTYAAVGIVVTLVTMMACYVPTRRAMGVDPLVVLRDQ